MKRLLTVMTGLAAAGLFAAPATAQFISDNFETDSSANYTVVDDSNGASGDGGADSTIDFGFDYVAAGIPLAPNSMPGDTRGLRMTVNDREEGDEGPSSTEEDHITAFNNTVLSGAYRLQVDMYMGVDSSRGGTTEFAHVGIDGSSTDFLSIFTPIVDNGHFVSITGEGGSSSDYRHSAPGSPAVPSGDASYLNADNTTNASAQLYQDLYPSTEFPGSPTNIWTTLVIEATDTTVTYLLDGVPIIRTARGATGGLAGLGLTDPFDSVGPHFVVYDNLVVGRVPEPTSALLGLTGVAMLALRRRNG